MNIERPMRVVVFGASGATGQWLVRLAIERGHQVTAIMREARAPVSPKALTSFAEILSTLHSSIWRSLAKMQS